MVDNISSKIRSGLCAQTFPLVGKVYFHAQIKRSCKPKKLITFLVCRQNQKGTGGTVFFLKVWKSKGA